ncbi:VOC family protein [Sulfitobacter aestuarii]|uniref:VOC family protein n=1 Tax=Sulfitobacter aestuarii TaxID=2161676 RepID=A0ABW5U1H4_9RHOB
MPIEKIFAQLACRDLAQSICWFEQLFDRSPDARPMAGLAEWHHGDGAGLQIFEDEAHAGSGTLTLIMRDLRGEHARLADAGLAPPAIEAADTTSLIRLRDPDGNLVVLAQPGRA